MIYNILLIGGTVLLYKIARGIEYYIWHINKHNEDYPDKQINYFYMINIFMQTYQQEIIMMNMFIGGFIWGYLMKDL
jgi:hypothetical protein